MATVEVPIPFNLTKEHLKLEPDYGHVSLGQELEWLYEHSTEEELPDILTAAVLLWHAKAGTIAECISTAITWARG